ncbi:MAG TPA: phage major capsid protein, partial [Ruminiclostridium sp.]|nr:phage major capsid protein [Ruminiclostridium sp.]
AKKSVVTRNSLILAVINALAPKTFTDWKAVKKALNVTLDPAFAANAAIFTNQDGYQLMDTWTDAQNRPLLKPDVTQPGGNTLFGKPIVVIPNSQLPTTGTTTKLAKVIVGDMAEMMVLFERQGHLIASTNIGGMAFRRNTTEVRVIEREDLKTVETDAVTVGQLDVTGI